jgi:hypothetical protein
MATVSIPYTFAGGGYAIGANVDANFSACASAINNIDNTNIGIAGLYPSQMLPTTAPQATFGGNQNYMFTNQVLSRGGNLLPCFLNDGTPSPLTKFVQGYVNTDGSGNATINLTGNAVFVTMNFVIYLSPQSSAATIVCGYNIVSASQFTIKTKSSSGSNVSVGIGYLCLGP